MVFDSNLINAATIGAGFFAAAVRPLRKKLKKQERCWTSQKAISDFLNGSSVVPFACLLATAFDPSLIPIIVENKAAMALAGGIGSIFIVGEVLSAGRDE
ncbi:hypothetical protein [Alcaligenes faecalis]|uniref:Uncharacterized protein n=1 Tax=Alcaligenes faecalis TaxID=511 RepID=A0A2U2BGG4_ALCFA|nr:hypothetical protein [Alcaligenes faecalis]PWE13082.1 hypothetical protein DF183_14710 [Alcaligenes faecalis]